MGSQVKERDFNMNRVAIVVKLYPNLKSEMYVIVVVISVDNLVVHNDMVVRYKIIKVDLKGALYR